MATLQKKDHLASLQIRTLNAQLAESRQALAAVVWSQEQQRGVLTIEKLKPPGPKEDYQLWVINALTPKPVSAGLIPVDERGTARYEFRSDAPVGAEDKFAISREKKGGGTKPEGPIIFLSP
jgi:anti-sigma-K factor RskA